MAPHRPYHSYMPLRRHLPEYSFLQHTRGQFLGEQEALSVGMAPNDSFPSNEPRPCCLQRGQDLRMLGRELFLESYLHTSDSDSTVLLFLALHYTSVILIFFKVLLTAYQPVFDYYNPIILNNYLY